MTKDRNISSQPLKKIRCAIYTRKSTEEGLDQEFNSLDAQRESAESYILSQRHEGWYIVSDRYDDGGFSGGSMIRPALQRLLIDIENRKIDCVVVYKVDRLSRSLTDFCKIMDLFEQHHVSFVSVTQSFNTTSSMGRLTLNILLSFAQFEREVIAERIRDKVAALKRKGMYTGGMPVLGYDIDPKRKKLVVNEDESQLVRFIFKRFIQIRSGLNLVKELNQKGYKTKSWVTKKGILHNGQNWNKNHIYRLLNNPIYIGEVVHKEKIFPGEHEPIISQELWDKVHEIFKENSRSRGAKTRSKTHGILRGVIKCGNCGGSMGLTYTRKKERIYRYYQCIQASKNGYDSCPVKTVPAGDIENAVIEQLKKIFKSPEIISRTIKSAKQINSHEVEQLKAKKKEFDRKLLSADIKNNSGEYYQIKEYLDKITGELSILETIYPNESEIFAVFNDIAPIWDELFPAEQERIIQLLINKVIVYKNGIDILVKTDGLNSLVSELDVSQETISDKNEFASKVI